MLAAGHELTAQDRHRLDNLPRLDHLRPRLLRSSRRSLERQRRLPLERGDGRLEEPQHLGDALERELLDAGGDGAEARDWGLESE